MGWAKYYEDDMSIYVGRMVAKDSVPLCRVQHCEINQLIDTPPVIVKPDYNKVTRPQKQNGRRGLELTFAQKPEKKLTIKLQMNGWWWSCCNNCWCNLDTIGNRKYAQRMISTAGARLAMVNP